MRLASIPRDAAIPDSNAIRAWGSLPLAAPESLSSAADRARPGHIRCAREFPRAKPATRLQKHFAGAQRCQIFLLRNSANEFFTAEPSPCLPRKSYCRIRSANGCPKTIRNSRPRQNGNFAVGARARGSLPAPESPSPRRQPNLERAREFSSRLARFPAPHGSADGAPKTLRQFKRNPATIHGKRGELHVSEIPHIFFRAQQRVGAATGTQPAPTPPPPARYRHDDPQSCAAATT